MDILVQSLDNSIDELLWHQIIELALEDYCPYVLGVVPFGEESVERHLARV